MLVSWFVCTPTEFPFARMGTNCTNSNTTTIAYKATIFMDERPISVLSNNSANEMYAYCKQGMLDEWGMGMNGDE